jgi:hypothetical protein
MHFYERNSNSGQSVTNRDAGVSEGGRVDDDEILRARGRLYTVYELVFSVALHTDQAVPGGMREPLQSLVNVIQGHTPVVFGFARTQQIQVGPMDDKDCRHAGRPLF